jgi:hypothetical protein
MHVVQWAFIIAGAVVQVLLIATLVRGSYRDFPFLFAYAVASFLATAVEVAAILDLMGWSRYTYKYYWINDAILQTLIVLLVLSLVQLSLREHPRRPFLMRVLGLAAVAVATISLAAYWDEPLNRALESGSLDEFDTQPPARQACAADQRSAGHSNGRPGDWTLAAPTGHAPQERPSGDCGQPCDRGSACHVHVPVVAGPAPARGAGSADATVRT